MLGTVSTLRQRRKAAALRPLLFAPLANPINLASPNFPAASSRA